MQQSLVQTQVLNLLLLDRLLDRLLVLAQMLPPMLLGLGIDLDMELRPGYAASIDSFWCPSTITYAAGLGLLADGLLV